MPAIDLTADELAAIGAAVRRIIETDRYPRGRASIRCGLRWRSFDGGGRARAALAGQSRQARAAITGGRLQWRGEGGLAGGLPRT